MKLTPIKGVFALLVGAIILKIFFPWWFVTLVIGGTTCFALYKWVITKTGVSPGWAKTLAGAAIFVFCVSFLLTYVETKWPWVAKAFDSRQLLVSLGVADRLAAKYPVDLSMKLAKFKEFKAKAEEQKYIKKIEAIEAKIAQGKDLSPEDEMVIKEAEEKLKELDKEMSKIHLSRPPSPEKKVSVPSNTEKQDISQQKQETNAKYLTFRFPVKAGEPTADIYRMPSGHWAVWAGPEETQIFDRDSRVIGPLKKEYGTRREFVEGIRFQSPIDGIVIIFQASKKEDLPPLQQAEQLWEKEQKAYSRTKAIAEPPSPPSKPVELAFLGKDCKFLKFEENEHVIRSPNWIIKLVSIKCVEDGKLKLKFLHTTLKGNSNSKSGLVWIENPEETTYLVDESGRKIGFLKEQNLGTKINQKGITVLGKEFPAQVPVAYSMIFSRPKDNVRVISFISKYSSCRHLPCFEQEDVVIRGVKLFIEKSQLTEINNPPEKKDRSSEALIQPEAQGTSEKKASQEIEPEGKMAEEIPTGQNQGIAQEEKKEEQKVSEEKKPSQSKKSVGRQFLERMLRDGQRSQKYPYRRY